MKASSPAVRRPRALLLAILLAGASARPGGSLAAQLPSHGHAITSWTTTQGLPSNAVLDVRQSREGYLWVASYQGLVRFDGVEFRVFTEVDIPGLARGSFNALAEDSSGALWAASEDGGIVRVREGRFDVFTTRHGLKSNRLTALTTDRAGHVWTGSRRGVNHLVNGRFEPLPAPDGAEEPYVSALAADAEHGVWIGTVSHGLLHYANGRYTHYGIAQGLPDDRISALHLDRRGTLWVGAYRGGLTAIRDGVVRQLPPHGSFVPQRVNAILEDGDGALWVGADNGLFHQENGRFEPIAQVDGRLFSRVEALRYDAEGSLWMGGRNGLQRLRVTSSANLTSGHGLPHDVVYAVAGVSDREAWIATHGGLAHWRAGVLTPYSVRTGALRDDVVRDVVREPDGTVWAATTNGLTRLRGGASRTFTVADGLVDDRTRALALDGRGGLWIGTSNGLSHRARGRFRSFGRAQGLPDGYILSVFVDRRGTVWVGTQSAGLFRYVNGRFARVSEELSGEPIFRMHEDTAGALWIGTTRGLVRLLPDGRVTRFTTRHGIPGNTVFEAIEDDLGDLWLTAPWGVGRVSRASLEAVAAGTRTTVDAKHFGLHDGMPAEEATSISRAWKTPSGQLWFATPNGLARLDPHVLRPNLRPPPVVLQEVMVEDSVYSPAPRVLDVPAGARKLEIRYTALGLVAPAQTHFRYRLEGWDRKWVEVGTRRTAFYTNLPPGSYTFRVQARNEDGVWNTVGAAMTVRLRPSFWQTSWFAVLVVLALSAIVLAVHRARVRRVRRLVQELEREGTRRHVSRILESVSDGFVALDDAWRFTYVNRTAEDMLQLPRAEALGRVCWDVVPEALRARLQPELERVAAERVPAVFETPSGSGRWLELRAHPAEPGVSVYFADVTVRKEAEAALRSLSLRDELTGLYNRRGLLALTEQAIRAAERRGQGFHVVFMDMDGLKAINDTLGHPQGDQALIDIATLMRRTFRESDVLARLGGDEFAAVLLEDDGADVPLICTRLRDAAARINASGARPYELSLSIGYSRFDPARPAGVEELLEQADQRMYAEKRAKRMGERSV